MILIDSAIAPRDAACPKKVEIAFLEAMQSVLGRLDFVPVGDGTLCRFHVPGDKAGTQAGAYALYLDCIPGGWFGTWKDGGRWHNWSSRKPANLLEAELLRQRAEQGKRQREAEQLQHQQSAREDANRQWRDAGRADPAHAYLIAKGCRPHSLRQRDSELLVPLYFDGELVSLQRIAPNGEKRFLPGGRTKGCYSPLGTIRSGQPLYLCEGWATGATIHEETGCPVACAMNCGNLLEVGRHVQSRYPGAVLVVAGDDDRQTKGNPGRTAAIVAATALNCGLILPPWPTDTPLHLTDFNDLRQWQEAQA